LSEPLIFVHELHEFTQIKKKLYICNIVFKRVEKRNKNLFN